MKEYTFHPACLAWPEMDEAALKKLAESIKKNGLREPIKVWRGQVVDGRNRLMACKLAGVPPVYEEFTKNRFADDAEVWTYTCDLNAHRRHLTREQLRAVIDAHLKATPERSNRQIAREVGSSAPTVAARRAELESTVKILQLPKTTGADGKERPARRRSQGTKKAPKPDMSGFSEPPPEPPAVKSEDAPTQETVDAALTEPVTKTTAAQDKPPRMPGQEFDVEARLVRDAITHIEKARRLLCQCEAKYGFGERSISRLRKAHAAFCEAMKGVE